MAPRHLHELLREEQEPFVLNNFINERRSHLIKPVPKAHLQVERRKPISQNHSFSGNSCKNSCFSSEIKKSPLFGFTSPAKSLCRNAPNTLFFNIPSRTASLLLEAALRIQKPKETHKNLGFGFLGSILKRIALRKRNRKREICGDNNGTRVSVKDILRWGDSFSGRKKLTEESFESREKMEGLSEMGFSCSCNSSSVWFESNEGESLDLETLSVSSCSTTSEDFEERRGDFGSCEKGSSHFEFLGVQRTESPAASPLRTEMIEKQLFHCTGNGVKKDYEEEKEQFSPVSVLEPPFEDDQDQQQDEGFEHSFTVVERAKHQLLQKIRRFERLAGLDPLELEKSFAEEEEEEEDNEDDHSGDDQEEENANQIESLQLENEQIDEFIREILSRSNVCHLQGIPTDMKRLVLDLIEEERDVSDAERIVTKVFKRLKSWKEVESNTIDMTVEFDLRREGDEWGRNHEQVGETAVQIELAIFGVLVEELSNDLVPQSRS